MGSEGTGAWVRGEEGLRYAAARLWVSRLRGLGIAATEKASGEGEREDGGGQRMKGLDGSTWYRRTATRALAKTA